MTGIPENESVDAAALDAAVGKVRAGLPSWAALPVEEKAGMGPDGRRYLVTGLEPDHECSLFRDEVFADVLGVVRLPAPDVESYLARAAGFANDALAGSLSATLLVDPDTEAHHRPAVTDAVAGLRYGANPRKIPSIVLPALRG